MLETLRIANYALIDEVEIDFRPGFNVLTGETGAGKSIVVEALNLALGARAASEIVRDGTGKAAVDAVFRIARPSPRLGQLLAESDIAIEDGELVVSRTVTAEGRSRGYISGTLVPIAVLAQVGDELVDLHGQHEHQSLLKVDRQLELLDAFGSIEKDAAEVANAVAELRALDRAIAGMETDDREQARRADFLRFEVAEIDAARLVPGEEENLRARRNLIANAERIVSLASSAYSALYESEETPAVTLMGMAQSALDELAEIDERFRGLAAQLTEARIALDNIAAEVRGSTETIEFDPAELDTVNQRLSLLSDLKRKYGPTVESILNYREEGAAEVERFEQRDQRLDALHKQREERRKAALKLATVLSEKRATTAGELDRHVTSALQELGMKDGRFETRTEAVELCTRGLERVEFMLAANPGEKLRPLRQVASGGEISRIMLAVKTTLAHADTIPTLIFDEIDAGVGGAVAGHVARALCRLCESHQVICITHLPQIAAAAETHFTVAKWTKKGRTFTTVNRVADDPRVEEIARLLDGSVSELSVEHARDLLARSMG